MAASQVSIFLMGNASIAFGEHFQDFLVGDALLEPLAVADVDLGLRQVFAGVVAEPEVIAQGQAFSSGSATAL